MSDTDDLKRGVLDVDDVTELRRLVLHIAAKYPLHDGTKTLTAELAGVLNRNIVQDTNLPRDWKVFITVYMQQNEPPRFAFNYTNRSYIVRKEEGLNYVPPGAQKSIRLEKQVAFVGDEGELYRGADPKQLEYEQSLTGSIVVDTWILAECYTEAQADAIKKTYIKNFSTNKNLINSTK